jgi:hypothetical protein
MSSKNKIYEAKNKLLMRNDAKYQLPIGSEDFYASSVLFCALNVFYCLFLPFTARLKNL